LFPHPHNWPLSCFSSSFHHSVRPPFFPWSTTHWPLIALLHSPDYPFLPFTVLPLPALGSGNALLVPYPPAWLWTSPCSQPPVGTWKGRFLSLSPDPALLPVSLRGDSLLTQNISSSFFDSDCPIPPP
jgi:hypothetical protein